jgi:hypothetical protein
MTPIQIDPDRIYEEGTVALLLDLPLATLSRARRVGELRFVRRGRRVFITGLNLLAWLNPSNFTPPDKKQEVTGA